MGLVGKRSVSDQGVPRDGKREKKGPTHILCAKEVFPTRFGPRREMLRWFECSILSFSRARRLRLRVSERSAWKTADRRKGRRGKADPSSPMSWGQNGREEQRRDNESLGDDQRRGQRRGKKNKK